MERVVSLLLEHGTLFMQANFYLSALSLSLLLHIAKKKKCLRQSREINNRCIDTKSCIYSRISMMRISRGCEKYSYHPKWTKSLCRSTGNAFMQVCLQLMRCVYGHAAPLASHGAYLTTVNRNVSDVRTVPYWSLMTSAMCEPHTAATARGVYCAIGDCGSRVHIIRSGVGVSSEHSKFCTRKQCTLSTEFEKFVSRNLYQPWSHHQDSTAYTWQTAKVKKVYCAWVKCRKTSRRLSNVVWQM